MKPWTTIFVADDALILILPSPLTDRTQNVKKNQIRQIKWPFSSKFRISSRNSKSFLFKFFQLFIALLFLAFLFLQNVKSLSLSLSRSWLCRPYHTVPSKNYAPRRRMLQNCRRIINFALFLAFSMARLPNLRSNFR